MGKTKRFQPPPSAKRKKNSIFVKIDNFITSLAYRRNRRKYLQSFKISDKYECEQPIVEGTSNADNESSTLRSVYDVGRYPLCIDGSNCGVYKSPNVLTIGANKFIVKADSTANEDDQPGVSKIMRKRICGQFSSFEEMLTSVKRSVSFDRYEPLQKFIGCLLDFKFELVHYSTVLDTTSEECVFKIIFGRKDIAEDMSFPVDLLNRAVEETPIVEIWFYDQLNLPEQDHEPMIKKRRSIDDLYCFLYLKTQPLMNF